MSTFSGTVKEYELIAIDSFRETNYEASTYFLSHCHSDHMYGLRDESFFRLLKNRSFSKIYLSEVSEHLLKNDSSFNHLSEFLVSLPLEQPNLILIPDANGKEHSRVVVTLLTAGHCPGSVMFLIEGDNGRVLYTGDFRLPVGSAARLNHLHDEGGSVKPLDSLYIDTTFCKKKYMHFPTREQCLDAVLPLVKTWLDKGSDHIIYFLCSAQYAYEFVFVELYKRFGEKTHVSEDRFVKYKGIKSIEDAVTKIPWDARIHACYGKKFQEKLYVKEAPCGYCTVEGNPIKVRLIKPSAMFFSEDKCSNIAQYDVRGQMYRVCYSTHSSLAEQRDMVQYLKPKKVYPNVVEGQSEKLILHLLQAPLSSDSSDSDDEQDVSPLGPLKNAAKDAALSSSSGSIQFYDECYKISGTFNKDKIILPQKRSPETHSNSKTTHNTSNCPTNHQCVQIEIVNQCNYNRNSSSATATCNQTVTTSSPLKWNFQSFSSDDENLDPNSSFCSSKDRSDSESICSSSQELCLKAIDNNSIAKNLPENVATVVSKGNLPEFTVNCFGKDEVQNKSERFQNEVSKEIVSVQNSENKTNMEIRISDVSSNVLNELKMHPSTESEVRMPAQFSFDKGLSEGVSSDSKPNQLQNSKTENPRALKQELHHIKTLIVSELNHVKDSLTKNNEVSANKFQQRDVSNVSSLQAQNCKEGLIQMPRALDVLSELKHNQVESFEVERNRNPNHKPRGGEIFQKSSLARKASLKYITVDNSTSCKLNPCLNLESKTSMKRSDPNRIPIEKARSLQNIAYLNSSNPEFSNPLAKNESMPQKKYETIEQSLVEGLKMREQASDCCKMPDTKKNSLEKNSVAIQSTSKSNVEQPFLRTKSDKASNSLADILFSIYNSDSDDSEPLELSSSWRKNKLVLDIETDEKVSHSSRKSKDTSAQQSALSARKKLNERLTNSSRRSQDIGTLNSALSAREEQEKDITLSSCKNQDNSTVCPTVSARKEITQRVTHFSSKNQENGTRKGASSARDELEEKNTTYSFPKSQYATTLNSNLLAREEFDRGITHSSCKNQDTDSQKSALSAGEELDLLINAINSDNAEMISGSLRSNNAATKKDCDSLDINIFDNSAPTKSLKEKKLETNIIYQDSLALTCTNPKALFNADKNKLLNPLSKNLSPNLEFSSDEIQVIHEKNNYESSKFLTISNAKLLNLSPSPNHVFKSNKIQQFNQQNGYVSSNFLSKSAENRLSKSLNQTFAPEFSSMSNKMNSYKSHQNSEFKNELNEEVLIIDEKKSDFIETPSCKINTVSHLLKETEVNKLKSSFSKKIGFQTFNYNDCNLIANSLNLSGSGEIFSTQNIKNIQEQSVYNSSLKFSSGTNSSSNSCKLTNSETSCKQHQVDEYYQPRKHDTIFGPNFKKKTRSSSCTENSSEIICLNDISSIPKENPPIQIIDLSTDEESDGEASKLSSRELKLQIHKSKNSNIALESHCKKDFEIDDSDVEVLDSSPSLLAPKLSRCNGTSVNSNSAIDQSSFVWKKRKSDEGRDALPPKNPKLDVRSNSPDIFDGNSESESTPEEFLPPTQKLSTFSLF